MAANIVFENTTKVDFGYAPVSVIEQFQRFRGGRATEQALRELLDRAKRRSNVFGFQPLRSGRRWFERLSNKNAHEVDSVLSELDSLRDAYRLVDRASVIELLLRTADDREGDSGGDSEEYTQMCGDADADGDVRNEPTPNGTSENDMGNSEAPQGNENESIKMRYGEEEEEEDDDSGELVSSERNGNEKATQTELAVATGMSLNGSNSNWTAERLSNAANVHSLSPNGATLNLSSQPTNTALHQSASSSATPSSGNSPSALELLSLLNNIASQRIAPQLLSHAAVNTYALKQQLEQNALLSFLLTQSTLMLSAPFLDLNSLATSAHCCSPLGATSPSGSAGLATPNASSRPNLARAGGKTAEETSDDSAVRASASVSPGPSRAVVSSSTELPQARSLSASSYDEHPQPVGVGFMTRFRVQTQHTSPGNKRKLTPPRLAGAFAPQQSALNLSTKLERGDNLGSSNEDESPSQVETDTRRPISSHTLKALKAKRLRNAVSSVTLASGLEEVDAASKQQTMLARIRLSQPEVADSLKVFGGSHSRLSASPNASGSDAPPASASGASQKRGSGGLRRGTATAADGERLRLFRCHVCSRAFYRKDHLRQHLTIHTTDKPIKCPIADCTYSCGQRNSLNWHLRTKHPQAFSQLAVLKHSSLDTVSSNVLASACSESTAMHD